MVDETNNINSNQAEDNNIGNKAVEETPLNTSSSTIGTKPPFADGGSDLSGLVSSVLKPQTEKEKQKLEEEIRRRKEKAAKENSSINTSNTDKSGINLKLVSFIIVFILVIFGVSKLDISSKSANQNQKDSSIVLNKKIDMKLPQFIEYNKVVFDKTFRLTVKSTPVVDKAVLAIGKDNVYKNYNGTVIQKNDSGTKIWEFTADKLARGNYDLKCYIKDTTTNKFEMHKDTFEIK